MAKRMVQIGARIPQEDAEFIAQLKIEGAATPSDKVRAIIAADRRRRQGQHDYPTSLMHMEELLAPVRIEVRQLELKQQVHSELIVRVLEWLPEMLAFLVASRSELTGKNGEGELAALEQNLADRVFRLMESVMQLGVTKHCPCYDERLVAERCHPILDLARVIEHARSTTQEE